MASVMASRFSVLKIEDDSDQEREKAARKKAAEDEEGQEEDQQEEEEEQARRNRRRRGICRWYSPIAILCRSVTYSNVIKLVMLKCCSLFSL